MDNGKLIFRRAVATDAVFIARMVAMAFGDDSMRRLGGERAVEAFEVAAGMEESQYSYRNVMVCEMDGEVVGAVCGYDGGRLHELRMPVLTLLRERCGAVPELADETQAGEFYIDSIGVAPRARGCGIGAGLLENIRKEAFSRGYQRVGLLVDAENPAAERLYERMGFELCGEVWLLGHRMFHMQSVKHAGR